MIEIKDIKGNQKNLINKIVAIHLAAFENFFLTFMGQGFLRLMYKCYCDFEKAGIIIALMDGEPVGFLAYSEDLSGLYKFMLRRKLLQFIWYSIGAFIRKPKIFLRLIRALSKPKESKREENYIEVTSLAVKPENKSAGIGTKLLSEIKNRVDFGKFKYICLETDAENNEAVNHFYQKNGFVLFKQYTTHEGRKMNEYRSYYNENTILCDY